MVKRRKILLIALPIVAIAMLSFFLFGQTPLASPELPPFPQPGPSTQSPAAPETIPSTPVTEVVDEPPPNLFVLPEAPLGPLSIVLTCFLALLIVQRKSKAR